MSGPDLSDYRVRFFERRADLSDAFTQAQPGIAYGYQVSGKHVFDSGIIVFPTVDDAESGALDTILAWESGDTQDGQPLPDELRGDQVGDDLTGEELKFRVSHRGS